MSAEQSPGRATHATEASQVRRAAASEWIKIRGARENNLTGIDVDVPKRAITVVTGVSGSGKSSLVFGTLAAESQRQLNDMFSAFAQNRLPTYGQPDVDSLTNLSAVAVIDQKPLAGGPRSTVGTVTDIGARLRLLFSRLGTPSAGYSNAYSFNDPAGMCPGCDGLGMQNTLDETALIDEARSLDEGALRFSNFAPGTWFWKTYAYSGLFDRAKPIADYTDHERWLLLYAPAGEVEPPNPESSGNTTYEGVVRRFERIYLHKDPTQMKGRQRESFERIVTRSTCDECNGVRLNERTRTSLINGRSIADHNAMQVDRLTDVIAAIDERSVAPLIAALTGQLELITSLGLGYLSLDRATATLSGGESQRVKMVRHLGSSLTDMLYIFDEPTVGLHPRDVTRVGEMMGRLRDKGNTVVVVEHDRETMAIADHCVDLGPGAGRTGGRITYTGDFVGLRASHTRTGEALRRPRRALRPPRPPAGALAVRSATTNNLKSIDVNIPTQVLTVVTGVAGSGKSSLIVDHLPIQVPGTVVVDQGAIRGSRRSSPLTFTGLLDPIRALFANATGATAATFSPNSEGACPACQGAGVIYTDLAFMEGVTTTCEQCQGRRFNAAAQQHLLRGRSIADVFEMTIPDALDFFHEPSVTPTLNRLNEVGLGYVTLGQTLTTLSGGERQRLRLATHLHADVKHLVLDEPTTGLHEHDIDQLLNMLHRIVDATTTVIVIEHNLDVIASADWIIDLGPDAGTDGGEIVFQGTPAELADANTHTGHALNRYLTTE